MQKRPDKYIRLEDLLRNLVNNNREKPLAENKIKGLAIACERIRERIYKKDD